MISIIFVGAFSQTGGCESAQIRREMNEGELFGEPVSRDAFRRARFFALGLDHSRGGGRESEDEIRRAVWQRLALLEKAGQLGIEVPPAELSRTIRETPMFSRPGEPFDGDYYRNVIRQQYPQATVAMFEEYLRQAMLLQRAIHLLDLSVWTPAREIDEELRDMADRFTVDYIVLPKDIVGDEPPISVGEAKAFYEDNPALFEEDEKISVRYVHFPIERYMADAEVPEDAILAFYEARKDEQFTREEGTNGVAVVQPLEDVREEIADTLRREAAFRAARTEAMTLAMALDPSRYGKGVPWDEALRGLEVNVATSAYFTAAESVEGIAVDADRLAMAFDLDPDHPNRYFSGVLAGEDGMYVLAAHNRKPRAIPEFSDILDKVMPLAKEHARRRAFMEKSQEIKTVLSLKLRDGASFSNAVAALDFDGIEPRSTRPFSIFEEHMQSYQNNDTEDALPYAWVLLPRIGQLGSGDLMDPVEVEDGLLIAHVARREPGELFALEMMRPSLRAEIDRGKADRLYEGWVDHLLTLAEFEDYRTASEPASGESL